MREGRVERHSAVQRNPPITFICELKKQIRRGLVLLGEGQSAISDRAGAAHGISNPKATEQGFRLCQQRRPEAFLEHAPSLTGAKSGKASFAGAIASLLSTWRLKWKYIGAAGNLRRAPALWPRSAGATGHPAQWEVTDQWAGQSVLRGLAGVGAALREAYVRPSLADGQITSARDCFILSVDAAGFQITFADCSSRGRQRDCCFDYLASRGDSARP